MLQNRGMVQKNIAVVTGASSGIGAASARRLATEGFHVVAAARRADRLESLSKEIRDGGGQVTAVPVDVTTDADVARLVSAATDLDGEVELLANIAGGAFGADPVAASSVDDWQRM